MPHVPGHVQGGWINMPSTPHPQPRPKVPAETWVGNFYPGGGTMGMFTHGRAGGIPLLLAGIVPWLNKSTSHDGRAWVDRLIRPRGGVG